MEQTICIFGDSITWGASDLEFGGWVARLRNYFEKENYDIDVYNCGVSGDNTENLLKRFKTEATAREPNIIIFAIGINDSQYLKSKDNPRVSPEDFQNNLNDLVNQAKKLANKIVFVGLTKVNETETMPIPWDTIKFYDTENVSKYNSIIKNFCQKNKLMFIDVLDLLKENDLEDGLHPHSKGHQKLFLKIKDFILEKKLI